MCGILGSINSDLPDRIVQLIRHRGPDGFGAKEEVLNGHQVQFYHHRLSIVDLSSNGAQPMPSADGKGLITFNGEIYNHADLRSAQQNVTYRGHSDTETLVNLCRYDCSPYSLARLNGIFSFAYLDIEHKKLFLARDRFGVKPLYYYFKDNNLIFSSELRAITNTVGQNFSIRAMAATLKCRHVPAPATLFKNIFNVEPGQLITIHLDKKLSVSKSYFADLPRRNLIRNTTRKRIITEYGQMLETAVERQLMSDVEVGILLSGGVDSSLIAAIAKTKVKNLKGFTVGFDDKIQDERASATETAAYLKLEHYTEEVKFKNFIKEFRLIINIVEEPIDGGSIFPMYTLSKLASSKVKVVLSGQGADEPLGGYTKYKALPAIDFLEKLSVFRKPFYWCSKYIRHQNLRRIFATAATPDNLRAYIEFNSLFGDHDIGKLMNQTEAESLRTKYAVGLHTFYTVLKQRNHLPDVRSDLFTYLDTRTKLPETLLKYTDKITMHFGLECRVPMLDNDLVEFIESLPRKYKFDFKTGKIIHKEFAREYLPPEMIHRKKLAFHGPSKNYIRDNSQEIREWLLQNDNRFFWSLFNKVQIVKLVDEHAKYGNREKELILLLSMLFLTEKKNEVVPAYS
jgi:asparagine synthase (glutamine-hydrolysing)